MKRKDQIGNALDDLIGLPGKNEKKDVREEPPTNNIVPTELVMVGVKIDKNVKKNLERHFASKGLNLSTGIRMVIMEYMNDL